MVGKVGPNFDPIVKIKQQPDCDWLAGSEMKWVMGKLRVGWVSIGAYDIV